MLFRSKIKVIVTDEQQNKKESKEINLKTEPRTYLYKKGNEYIQLTGGWKEIYKSDYPTTPVSTTFEMNKLKDNIKISSTGGTTVGGAILSGAAVGTTERIDISDFKYMYTTITAKLGKYQAASVCEMTLDSDNEHLVSDPSAYMCITNPIENETIKWDITKYNGMYSPAIYIQSQDQLTSEANIYEVWLEK